MIMQLSLLEFKKLKMNTFILIEFITYLDNLIKKDIVVISSWGRYLGIAIFWKGHTALHPASCLIMQYGNIVQQLGNYSMLPL